MKKAGILLAVIAVLLSDAMCAVVAYAYRDMRCGIEHLGCSAPASVAFLYAIPFALAIALCAVLACVCLKRAKKK